jgi:transcription factor MBP1
MRKYKEATANTKVGAVRSVSGHALICGIGTWVPLTDGRALAEKNGILRKLSKIFDYVPGDRSPPPAPKHTTAASNRPKTLKPPVQSRKPVSQSHSQNNNHHNQSEFNLLHLCFYALTKPAYYRPAAEHYDNASVQYNEDESIEDVTPESASFFGEEDMLPMSQQSTGSRKRKRGVENGAFSNAELEHTLYGDELLDYFVTSSEENGSNMQPPAPPRNFDVDRPIDTQGNNALHWACAMGDVGVMRDLLARGASPAAQNEVSGETPLIRAVLFTNNYDKQSFPKVVAALQNTITERDWHGATVFHHIAETARSRSKWSCARYYTEVLINKLLEMGPTFVQALLITQDKHHDTAVLCAIRNNCVKVATFLLNHCPEAGDIPNLKGETANEYFRSMSEKRHSLEQPPSSPLRPGETFGSKRHGYRSKRNPHKSTVSRAASQVLTRVGPMMEEASFKLANMYDAEMKEKDISIAEAKQSLSNFESQRHKIRQETFALMAKAEDDSELNILRGQYEECVRENESLLEQREHSSLQNEVLLQDQQAAPHAFRSANPRPLTQDELRATVPWVLELYRQQSRRRELVKEVAQLLGDAGTSEKIGKHRKLVSIATGLKEEELDTMSVELLESLEATQVAVMNGPKTPPTLAMDMS